MCRIALRVLLCLLLVLNGTGYAVAATQMHVAHLATAVAAEQAESVPPCHEAAASETAAIDVHAHGGPAPDDGGPASPSCCQSSLCNCDCLQHATAAMSVIALPSDAPAGAEIAQLRVANRIAPPQPNLLRPPIA